VAADGDRLPVTEAHFVVVSVIVDVTAASGSSTIWHAKTAKRALATDIIYRGPTTNFGTGPSFVAGC
jgi:hypothetical protein